MQFEMETYTFFLPIFFFTFKKPTAVRSGDYYLFEDLDEKVELDLLHERPSAVIDDAITDRKLSDKMTIEQVIFFLTRPMDRDIPFFHAKKKTFIKNNDSFLVVNKSSSRSQIKIQCTKKYIFVLL